MLLSYSTKKEMKQSLCLIFVRFPCRNVACISLEQAEEKLISVGPLQGKYCLWLPPEEGGSDTISELSAFMSGWLLSPSCPFS